MVRGEVFRVRSPRSARGHEQRGARYGVVVQADEFLNLSTALIAPTSTSARAGAIRPQIVIDGVETLVMVDQVRAIDPGRLGASAGYLDVDELRAVDEALALVLGL